MKNRDMFLKGQSTHVGNGTFSLGSNIDLNKLGVSQPAHGRFTKSDGTVIDINTPNVIIKKNGDGQLECSFTSSDGSPTIKGTDLWAVAGVATMIGRHND